MRKRGAKAEERAHASALVDDGVRLRALRMILGLLALESSGAPDCDPEVVALVRAGLDERAFCAATGASVAEAIAKLAPIAL